MAETTPLDEAFAAMKAGGEDDMLRSGYFGVLAASEVFVLLDEEAGTSFSPTLVEMEGARYVLCFDTVERLAAFSDGPQDYVSMSGRALVAQLQEARLGLAVNAGFETAMFLGTDAVDWIAGRTSGDIEEAEARIEELLPPDLADAKALGAIDARLSVFAGPGRRGYLVKAHTGEGHSHLMVLVGIPVEARGGVAGALAEALRFVAPDLACDTIFAEPQEPIVKAASQVALRFDMEPGPGSEGPAAPGMDPDKPPRLH